MALAFLNRCGFVPTANGSSTWTVSSAVSGFVTPANATNPSVVDGATYQYFAESSDKSEWEVGYGVYTVSGTTLTRATVLSSTNGGAAVSFTAAPNVYMGAPLAANMGYGLIASGSVSGATLTIDLPARFNNFRLELNGFFADSGWLALQFSDDGGSTWSSSADGAFYGLIANTSSSSATAGTFSESKLPLCPNDAGHGSGAPTSRTEINAASSQVSLVSQYGTSAGPGADYAAVSFWGEVFLSSKPNKLRLVGSGSNNVTGSYRLLALP